MQATNRRLNRSIMVKEKKHIKPASIVCWNCNSAKDKYDAVSLFLQKQQPDVLVLTETKTKDDDLLNFRTYNSSFSNYNHHSRSSGVGFIIKQSIPFSSSTRDSFILPVHGNSSAIVVKTIVLKLYSKRNSACKEIAIIGVYSPPGIDKRSQLTLKNRISTVIRNQTTVNREFVVTGDVNCSSTLAGDSDAPFPADTNAWAEEFAEEHALFSANLMYAPDKPTRRHSHRIIDWALASQPSTISDLKVVDDDLLISDHFPLFISLNSKSAVLAHRKRLRMSLEDSTPEDVDSAFSRFAAIYPKPPLDFSLDSKTNSQSHIDEYWNWLAATLRLTVAGIGEEIYTRTTPKKWWCRGLTELLQTERKHKKKLEQLKRTSPPDEAAITAQIKLHSTALHAFRDAQEQKRSTALLEIANKCVRQNESGNTEIVWKEVRKLFPANRTQLNSIKNANGTLPSSEKESINNLASSIANVYNRDTDLFDEKATNDIYDKLTEQSMNDRIELELLTDATEKSREQEQQFNEFSSKEMERVLNTLNAKKASGPDDVSNELLKKSGPLIRAELLKLFNFSYLNSVTPTQWKISKCCAIHKKGDINDPDNFRIIALECCSMKVMERLILNRIKPVIEPFLHKYQFGFRSKRCTADALYLVIKKIFCTINRSEAVPIAFLDLSKAFDKVPITRLLQMINKYDIAMRDKLWLQSFLLNRKFFISSNDTNSDAQQCTNGVPQGSVLAPFLFILYINELPMQLERAGVNCDAILFADDIALVPRSTGFAAIQELRDALNVTANWARSNGMQFSTGIKNGVVIFRPKSYANNPVVPLNRVKDVKIESTLTALCDANWHVGDIPIPVVESYKYLGVHLHKHGCWNVHYKHLLKQVNQTANIIQRFMALDSAITGNTVITLTKILIYSVLNYSIAFVKFSPKQQNALNNIILRPIRCALGLNRSAHRLSIFVETGLLQIDLLQAQAMTTLASRWYRMAETMSNALSLYGDLPPIDDALRLDPVYNTVGIQFIADMQRTQMEMGSNPIYKHYQKAVPTVCIDYYPILASKQEIYERLRTEQIARWAGCLSAFNQTIDEDQKRWGQPLKSILFPMGIDTVQLYEMPARIQSPPLYFNQRVSSMRVIAALRFDTFTPWRVCKTYQFPQTECPLCTPWDPDTLSNTRHYLTSCGDPDIVEARENLRDALEPNHSALNDYTAGRELDTQYSRFNSKQRKAYHKVQIKAVIQFCETIKQSLAHSHDRLLGDSDNDESGD